MKLSDTKNPLVLIDNSNNVIAIIDPTNGNPLDKIILALKENYGGEIELESEIQFSSQNYQFDFTALIFDEDGEESFSEIYYLVPTCLY